ncbi:MAG TPA: hypothetical protein VF701_10730 [Thermoanaerobaculia bacterium]
MQLNRADYLVMALLGQVPHTVEELRRRASEELVHVWSTRISLASTISQLCRSGMAEQDEEALEATGERRFRLTERGRRQLALWTDREPERTSQQNEALLKLLAVGLDDSERSAAVLVRYRAALLNRVGSLTAALRNHSRLPRQTEHSAARIVTSHELFTAHAAINWCDYILRVLGSEPDSVLRRLSFEDTIAAFDACEFLRDRDAPHPASSGQ